MPMALLTHEESTVKLPDHLSCREVDVTIRGENKIIKMFAVVKFPRAFVELK